MSISNLRIKNGDDFISIFPITTAQGGTGATTAAQALTNLGAASSKDILTTNVDNDNLCRLNYYSCNSGTGSTWADTKYFDFYKDENCFVTNHLQRNYGLSNTFAVQPGEIFYVSFGVRTDVYGPLTNGGTDYQYLTARFGIAFQNQAGSSFNWNFPVYTAAEESPTKLWLSAYCTVPELACSGYVLFSHNGYPDDSDTSSGQTYIWNPVVKRIGNFVKISDSAPTSDDNGAIWLEY